MKFSPRRVRLVNTAGLLLVMLLAMSTSAFAQGSIFGTVNNADATVPANGEISFVGYLDNTDEEIRIETSDGAGYDAGNWFDDFQNYLTEAPGNPYDYHFYNTANGEGFQLSGAVPNNSFQQENVTLAPVSWPVAPVGLTGVTMSGSSVLIRWTGVGGLTYRVYRRVASSNGSFFRVDDPSGSLSNPGVSTNYYIDGTVTGGNAYTYLIIARDPSGNLSPHSATITVNTAAADAPVLTSINPTTGTASGGVVVTVNGSGFDPAGAQVLFGTSPVAATVLSPFQMTVVTPAGAVGAVVDVTVTNTASGLSSNTLVGGFTYSANAAPVLAAIGPRSVIEGQLLQFSVSATDLDGVTPLLSTSTLPTGASFVDNGNGTASFNWTPTFTNAGLYPVTFYATDGTVPTAVDSEAVVITVVEAGNQTPVLASIGARSVTENNLLTFAVSATDVDATIPTLSAAPLPSGAGFVDNGNGTGTFNWTPGFAQQGNYFVTFVASDGLVADSEVVQITVLDGGNQTPVLAAIGPRSVSENSLLNFTVSATDADAAIPLLTAAPLPTGATFLDNGDGTGAFSWIPGFAQQGQYFVTFVASDGVAADSEVVQITVIDGGNQTPVLATIGPRTVAEDNLLSFTVSATDPDATIPTLTAAPLPTGAAFVDNGDGTGAFSWTPDFSQQGDHFVTFVASDGAVADSELVQITVVDAGNQPPVVTSVIGDQTVAENSLLSLVLTATDADGTIPGLSAALTGTVDLAPNMTFVDNGDGTGAFDFTPDFTQAGVFSVAFKATDVALSVDSLVVQITVTDVNQPPVLAAIGPQSTPENVPLSFAVAASDLDGATPVLSTSTLPGTAVFTDNGNGTGQFDWTPGFAEAGNYNVTFYAVDGTFSSDVDSELVVITVTDAGNQAPVITSTFDPRTVFEGDSLFVLLEATDADGTVPQLSAVMEDGSGLVTNMVFVDSANGRGALQFRPDFNQSGAYSVAFIASDGALADTALLSITVTEAGNMPPVFAVIGNFSVDEAEQLVINVSATDPDGSVAPSLSLSTTLSHYTFVDNGDGTGTLTYNPTYFDAGTDTLNFVALDFGTPRRTGSAISVVTTIDINQPPTITAPGPFSVRAEQLLQFTVTATDSTDPNPAHRVLLSAIGLPANASFTDNGNSTGTFSFTPTEAQAGVIAMTFLAIDQGTPQLSATLPITITVVVQNHPPVIAAIQPQIVTEGELLTINVSATDVDGTIPTLDTAQAPEGSSFVDNGDGTGVFTFTPDYYGHTRLTSVIFKAYDGIDVTRTNPVLIQINDAGNQAPYFDSIPAPSITEGETLTQVITASDPDRDPLILAIDASVMSLPPHAAFVDNGDGSGTLTFSPDFTQSGFYDIYVAVFDGPVDGTATLADTVIMTVGVIEFGNHAPVLAAITNPTTAETLTLNFGVSATDIDADSVVLLTGALPANATFTDNYDGTGSFSFSPDYTQQGTHDIWFIASDLTDADSQLVTITVIDVNLPPSVFTSDNPTIYEGDTLLYVVEGFDGDGTIPFLDASLSGFDTLATNMTFVDTRDGFGTLRFVPGPTQGGLSTNPTRYTVVFTAADETYPDSIAISPSVVIRVVDRNFPPVLTFPFGGSGPFTLAEGTTLEIISVVTDVDMVGDFPSIRIENPPDSNYTFAYNSALGRGTFTFTPDFTQDGLYTVRFIATDERAAADTVDVTITVTDAGNQTPTFVQSMEDTLRVPINYIYDIVVEAYDPELDSMTLTANPIIPGAVWTNNGDGTWTYSFVLDSSGLGEVFSITFVATDYPAQTTATMVVYSVGVSFLRGDLDQDNIYTVNDLAYMIDYLFRSGPPPVVDESGDIDKDGTVTIGDLSYLIFYMYKNGPAPLP